MQSMNDEAIIARTVRAYDNGITRAYASARFHIVRRRFLEEIGQYLPESGNVLDIGCGFGLFTLFFAQKFPWLQFHGMDPNARRIEHAEKAAARLKLRNVSYVVGDARTFQCTDRFEAAYMLDVVHHIPKQAVRPLLDQLALVLGSGCRLIVKDVDVRPAYKCGFTYIMDKLVDPHGPVRYWAAAELTELLSTCGFKVHRHAMIDYLPYPHMLYVCTRKQQTVVLTLTDLTNKDTESNQELKRTG